MKSGRALVKRESEALLAEQHFMAGAAVAFGLMGMAEAIRNRCSCPPWRNEDGTLIDWSEVCQRCKGYP